MNLRVLIIDDEQSFGDMLGAMLRKEGYEVRIVQRAKDGLAILEKDEIDLVLCDVQMPEMSGLEFLREGKMREVLVTTIVMSAYGSNALALEAMKAGAYDYISKPFNRDEILLTLRKAEERERLKRENLQLKRDRLQQTTFDRLVARSEPMMKLFRTIEKVAAYKSTVLLTGESGTGKELTARAIHKASPRAQKPFVAVNCGAIPETLLESELFGYVKGAFTDAYQDKRGLFAEANGGTLFLDEIGELPQSVQVKLLRALQEEEVRRVGDTRSIKVDVRVIAATVRDLTQDVKDGRFREDLFYRLNVLPIHLPPVRERQDDIALLVDHFVELTNKRLGTSIRGLTKDAMKLMMEYSWPGNVREIENTLERATVLSEGEWITREMLPDRVTETRDPIKRTLLSGELSIKKTTRVIEEELIRKALLQTSGNRTAASRILELSHRALLYKIKEFGIHDL